MPHERMAAVTLVWLAYACTPIAVDDCAIRCERSCPSGLQCRAGFCVSSSFSGSCDAPSVAPRDGGLEAVPLDDAADAAAARSRRDAGTAGAEPSLRLAASCEASGDLQITPCPPPAPCLGVPYASMLGVSGGAPPYRWTATGARRARA